MLVDKGHWFATSMAHAHKPYLCWCHLPWSGAACGVGYDLHVCVVAYSRDIVSPQAGGGCPQETSGHPPAHGSLPVPPLSPALSMHHHPSVGRWWRLVRQWRSRGHTLRGVPNRFPLRRPAGELCPPTHCVQPPTLLPPRGATWEPPISAQCQGVMVTPGTNSYPGYMRVWHPSASTCCLNLFPDLGTYHRTRW